MTDFSETGRGSKKLNKHVDKISKNSGIIDPMKKQPQDIIHPSSKRNSNYTADIDYNRSITVKKADVDKKKLKDDSRIVRRKDSGYMLSSPEKKPRFSGMRQSLKVDEKKVEEVAKEPENLEIEFSESVTHKSPVMSNVMDPNTQNNKSPSPEIQDEPSPPRPEIVSNNDFNDIESGTYEDPDSYSDNVPDYNHGNQGGEGQ